jgi:hypothetical protein
MSAIGGKADMQRRKATPHACDVFVNFIIAVIVAHYLYTLPGR